MNPKHSLLPLPNLFPHLLSIYALPPYTLVNFSKSIETPLSLPFSYITLNELTYIYLVTKVGPLRTPTPKAKKIVRLRKGVLGSFLNEGLIRYRLPFHLSRRLSIKITSTGLLSKSEISTLRALDSFKPPVADI